MPPLTIIFLRVQMAFSRFQSLCALSQRLAILLVSRPAQESVGESAVTLCKEQRGLKPSVFLAVPAKPTDQNRWRCQRRPKIGSLPRAWLWMSSRRGYIRFLSPRCGPPVA